MYKEEYKSTRRSVLKRRQARRRRQRKKMTTLLVSIVLVLTVGIGGTIAYISTKTQPVKNTFNPSKVAIEVLETFDGKEKTDVSVNNTGDTDVYIRATIVVNWVDTNGNILAEAPADKDYTLTLASGTGWDTATSDGYYYYTLPVTSQASTGVLISSCEPKTTKAGYHLSVEILAEAIQSSPEQAVQESWGVTVADDGTISK